MNSPGISTLTSLSLCLPARRKDLFVQTSVVSPPRSPALPLSRGAAPDSGLIFLMTNLFSWQDLSELNSTTVKSPTNTVAVQNLKAGTIYVFQVRARTVAGYGRYSGKMYFQTMTEGESAAASVKVAQGPERCGDGRAAVLVPLLSVPSRVC